MSDELELYEVIGGLLNSVLGQDELIRSLLALYSRAVSQQATDAGAIRDLLRSGGDVTQAVELLDGIQRAADEVAVSVLEPEMQLAEMSKQLTAQVAGVKEQLERRKPE